MERDLQHSEHGIVAHLAVRLWREARVVASTACPDHELSNTKQRIGRSIRILRREALVVVVVPVQHHISACRIEVSPQLLGRSVVSVLSGAEAGLVPVRERAGIGMRGQVGKQPPFLRRARADGDLRVERDHVPGADVPAVVERGGARVPEVVAVALCIARAVLVVAGNRPYPRLV